MLLVQNRFLCQIFFHQVLHFHKLALFYFHNSYSSNILFVILTTAFVTGLTNFIFFPNIQLLGASGVVFAFILLASMTSIKEGKLPLTFILVAVLYIGEQIYSGIFIHDNVSNLTHIIGGAVGSVLGYIMNKNKMNRY